MDDGSASARGAMDSAGRNRGASAGWRGEGDPRCGRVQAFKGRREGSRREEGRVRRSRQAAEPDGRSAGARPRLGPALHATPGRGSSLAKRCSAAGAAPALLRCGRRDGGAGKPGRHGRPAVPWDRRRPVDRMFPKRGGPRSLIGGAVALRSPLARARPGRLARCWIGGVRHGRPGWLLLARRWRPRSAGGDWRDGGRGRGRADAEAAGCLGLALGSGFPLPWVVVVAGSGCSRWQRQRRSRERLQLSSSS
jgi:hypothetical protein